MDPDRRVFLSRAAGLVLTLGAAPLLGPRRAHAQRDPYGGGGVWMAGDHHLHTKYSIDGIYEIEEQVAAAVEHGLDFCVLTDHGGPGHDKVALDLAYPQLLAARKKHPQLVLFQGLEWNIPAAEHGSIIVPPTEDEARCVADFEARFDERNTTARKNKQAEREKAPGGNAMTPAEPAAEPANTEAAAVAGVQYLQERRCYPEGSPQRRDGAPRPLMFANHPARRGIDSPHELRAWSEAGPDVMRGFEGAPGHGASPLLGEARGHYGDKPGKASFPGYPLESYRTWGGYDYYVAQVGGLWDSLLGEGRAFYITANSDSHRFLGDHRAVDRSTYRSHGAVTRLDQTQDTRPGTFSPDQDYPPGAYAKTWVYARDRSPLAVLEAMRAGNMFTAIGGLIETCALWCEDGEHAAPMGSTLLLSRRGRDVELTVRIGPATRKNLVGQVPRLHHIDLIAGQIRGPGADRDALKNPTARVVAQLPVSAARRVGGALEFRYRFPRVVAPFYVRARGTSTAVKAPQMDAPPVDVWGDLWFYTNPVLIQVPA